MKVLEFYDRARTGRRISEKEFNLNILPGKLRELVKKHDISFNPEEPVPQDLDMAKRVFDAALELLTEVGIYCLDTKSIITIEEEEIRNALANAPASHTIGEGTEAVECYCRSVGDKRRPTIIGGANGAPLSEENYIDILTSYAKESIDGLHTGSLQGLFGRTVRAREPVELLACKYEALWAREAVRRAGKPGLSILGIMSGATSESQDAADFEGGLRPCDLHLVVFLNELKVNWEVFNKIVHNQNLGNIIDACMGGPLIGGFCGGPEGSAVTAVAEIIQGYVIAKPATFSMYASNFLLGSSDRLSIWVSCMASLAFKSAGVDIILAFYVGGDAGPCTEMLCDEIAAQAIALTASGASSLYGAAGCSMAKMDYTTGMEARILCSTSRAAAGMNLGEANEIVKDLIGTYEETLKNRKSPVGKSFVECYEQGLTPSKEYLDLWRRKRKALEKMGLALY